MIHIDSEQDFVIVPMISPDIIMRNMMSNGYPDGLKGEEISIAAQIVSLVDVYDALSSRRVYKAAYKTDKVYQMIINGQSGAFSSKLLKAFTEVRKQFEVIVTKYCDDCSRSNLPSQPMVLGRFIWRSCLGIFYNRNKT